MADGQPVSVDYGISNDQEIAHELFRHCLAGAKILGLDDHPLIERMRKVLPRLALPRIGQDGRLLEWRDERVEFDPFHRHFSHLYGFHPGNRITLDGSPKEAAAVMRTLRYRMSGSTEGDYAPSRLDWRQGWLLNIWARFRDADLFQRTYEDFYRIFVEPNLNSWWQTRPYQFDGSGAFTAGIVEALLQSHAGEIHILPCLPPMWPEGSFRGFRARGGITVNVSWDPRTVDVELVGNRDGRVRVRYGNEIRFVTLRQGQPTRLKFTSVPRNGTESPNALHSPGTLP